jgi:hypothetical protein
MKFGTLLLVVMLLVSHCDTNGSVVKQRSYLTYPEYGLILMFDNNDSLDGFVMRPCSLRGDLPQAPDSQTSESLIPGVGVFGIRFDDPSVRVISVLGEPIAAKKPTFTGVETEIHLLMWQRGDTTLIVNLYRDSVNMITDYLLPANLPFDFHWRARKDSVLQIMGPTPHRGEFETKLPIRF